MKDNYEYFYSLDFSKLTDYKEIHPIIQKSLDFPDYYGKNWDAFWDCITDMITDTVHIEIRGIEQLKKIDEKSEKMLMECLKEFKHVYNDRYSERIKIELIIKNAHYEIH